jgi:hypothetical protein
VTADGVSYVMKAFFRALGSISPDEKPSTSSVSSAGHSDDADQARDVVCEEMMLDRYGG